MKKGLFIFLLLVLSAISIGVNIVTVQYMTHTSPNGGDGDAYAAITAVDISATGAAAYKGSLNKALRWPIEVEIPPDGIVQIDFHHDKCGYSETRTLHGVGMEIFSCNCDDAEKEYLCVKASTEQYKKAEEEEKAAKEKQASEIREKERELEEKKAAR